AIAAAPAGVAELREPALLPRLEARRHEGEPHAVAVERVGFAIEIEERVDPGGQGAHAIAFAPAEAFVDVPLERVDEPVGEEWAGRRAEAWIREQVQTHARRPAHGYWTALTCASSEMAMPQVRQPPPETAA